MAGMSKSRTTASKSQYKGYFNEKEMSEMPLFKWEFWQKKKTKIPGLPGLLFQRLPREVGSHWDLVLLIGKVASGTACPPCLCIDSNWHRGNRLTLPSCYSIIPALLRRPSLSIRKVMRQVLKWKWTETRKTMTWGEWNTRKQRLECLPSLLWKSLELSEPPWQGQHSTASPFPCHL